MSRRSWLIACVTALLVVTLIVSCAPAATPTVEPTPPPPPTPTPAPEPVTLQVWYLSQSPEEMQLLEEFSARFEEKHPGVTVEFSAYGFDDMNKTLKLALDAGTGPDVAYSSPGEIGLVSYAKAGHLIELTDIVKQRGWDQNHPMDAIMYYNIPLGGRIYGVPYDVVLVGVFYNKDFFNELGLEPPDTFEEFDSLLASLKENGYTPFSCGALDGWTLDHYFQLLLHVTTPIEKIQALAYVQPGVSYTEDSFIQAATILKSWVDKGYFNEGFLASSYDDQNNLFITGQTAMNIGGTWNNATFIEQADFEVGFFALPRVNPDLDWHALNTPNNVWEVPVYSEHQDLVIDYIDYMMGEEVARALWSMGDIPTFKFTTVPEPIAGLQLDVYQAAQNTGTGYYFTDNMPEVMPVEWAAIQGLAAGELTPEEAMAMIEEEHAKAVAERE